MILDLADLPRTTLNYRRVSCGLKLNWLWYRDHIDSYYYSYILWSLFIIRFQGEKCRRNLLCSRIGVSCGYHTWLMWNIHYNNKDIKSYCPHWSSYLWSLVNWRIRRHKISIPRRDCFYLYLPWVPQGYYSPIFFKKGLDGISLRKGSRAYSRGWLTELYLSKIALLVIPAASFVYQLSLDRSTIW